MFFRSVERDGYGWGVGVVVDKSRLICGVKETVGYEIFGSPDPVRFPPNVRWLRRERNDKSRVFSGPDRGEEPQRRWRDREGGGVCVLQIIYSFDPEVLCLSNRSVC